MISPKKGPFFNRVSSDNTVIKASNKENEI